MSNTNDPCDTSDTRLPHEIDAVWIDRQSGSGSLNKVDGWSQNKHTDYEYANDGRSQTHTTFYWNGDDDTPSHLRDRDRHQLHRDPDDRRSWERLAEWNDGVGSSSRKQDNYDADVERWVQTFCNQLDLTDYQYERVRFIVVDDLDLSTFGWIPAEHVIIGTVSLVIDVEQTVDPDEWTPDDWIIYQDDFEDLMDATDMERGTLWTVRKQVHAKADSFCEADE